jgi:hypothetical protein
MGPYRDSGLGSIQRRRGHIMLELTRDMQKSPFRDTAVRGCGADGASWCLG